MGGVYSDITALLAYREELGKDEYVKNGLEESYDQYILEKRPSLCKVRQLVESIDYPNIYQPLDFFDEVSELRLHFVEPDTKKHWDYNRPTMELTLKGDGKGGSLSFRYDPERFDNWERPSGLGRDALMYAIFITRGYEPVSLFDASNHIQEPDPYMTSPHHSIRSFWHTVRSGKVIPFEIRICAYTKTDRRIYDIDLTRNRLLPDFRNGKVAAKNVVNQPVLDTMYFDRIWAGSNLPPLNKNIFMLLFHSNGITPQEVSVVFGININMAKNHLKSLESRGYAKADKNGNLFKAATEDFKKITEDISFS
ncbi:MAG TPA: hypothetical protein ENN76_02935 [Euryarchaeota archaeon]|nr:hypothetical protein [Euryarchaeota archaeon]